MRVGFLLTFFLHLVKSDASFPKPLIEELKSPFDTDYDLLSFDNETKTDNLEESNEPPACSRQCFKDMNNAISLLFDEMNHVERFKKMCSNYEIAEQCVKETECDKKDLEITDTWTSGIRYMCVDQRLAFNATIYCIDSQSPFVQNECEQQCQTKVFFMNYIMQATMRDAITKGIVNAATGENPLASLLTAASKDAWSNPIPVDAVPNSFGESMRSFKDLTGGLCKMGDCLLDCLKNKFNTRCEGSAGTLLTEMFVRPIATSQMKMSMISPFLGMILPEHCSNFYSGNINKYRIDPSMDKELKRMYSERQEKERRAQELELKKLNDLEKETSTKVKFPSGSPLDNTISSSDIKTIETTTEVKRANVTKMDVLESNELLEYSGSELKEESIEQGSGSGSGEILRLDNEESSGNSSGDILLNFNNDNDVGSGENSGSGEGDDQLSEESSGSGCRWKSGRRSAC